MTVNKRQLKAAEVALAAVQANHPQAGGLILSAVIEAQVTNTGEYYGNTRLPSELEQAVLLKTGKGLNQFIVEDTIDFRLLAEALGERWKASSHQCKLRLAMGLGFSKLLPPPQTLGDEPEDR